MPSELTQPLMDIRDNIQLAQRFVSVLSFDEFTSTGN